MQPLVVVRQRPRPIIGTVGLVPDRQFEVLEAELDWLELHGVPVERIDPTTDPTALNCVPEAARVWQDEGPAALPLVVINGHVVTRGHPPSHRALIRLAASDESRCSISAVRHIAALAVAAALGRDDDVARERSEAAAAGFDSARLDAIENEARRLAPPPASKTR